MKKLVLLAFAFTNVSFATNCYQEAKYTYGANNAQRICANVAANCYREARRIQYLAIKSSASYCYDVAATCYDVARNKAYTHQQSKYKCLNVNNNCFQTEYFKNHRRLHQSINRCKF